MTDIELKDGERVNQLFSSDVKIIQNREVFSYSVDSVLLSRFPKLPKRGLIVDLCAGNGAVGLFASTRTEAQSLSSLQFSKNMNLIKKESGTEIGNSLEFDFVVPPPHS